ncbi:hypothetical protein Tco_0384765 [Tanacetum coccineum]
MGYAMNAPGKIGWTPLKKGAISSVNSDGWMRGVNNNMSNNMEVRFLEDHLMEVANDSSMCLHRTPRVKWKYVQGCRLVVTP